jgi:hypothetical protein
MRRFRRWLHRLRGDCTTIFGHSTEFRIIGEKAYEKRVLEGDPTVPRNPPIYACCRRCGKSWYDFDENGRIKQ